MVSYGVLKCTTIPGALASTTVAAMIGNSKYTCNSFNSNSCTYQTFTTGQPSYSSPSITSNTMTLIGTNLNMAGYDSCEITHAGVKADACALNAGNAVGTWSLGVPLARTPISPILIINVINSPLVSH